MIDIFKVFRAKPIIKTAHETTMNEQKTNLETKIKKVKKKNKKPEIRILFSQMNDVREFEDMIENYYTMGFKLIGACSIHGFTVCATLIKE